MARTRTDRSCPSCGAPVGARAVTCALCDHVLDRDRIAAAARAADRRSSRAVRVRGVDALGGIVRQVGIGAIGALLMAGVVVAMLGFVTVDRAQDDAAEWGADAEARLARLAAAWPEVEAAARAAAAPVRSGAVDRAALRELLAATTPPDAARRDSTRLLAFDVDTTAWSRFGAPELSRLADGRQLRHGVPTHVPVRLADAQRARFAADTASPWLGAWRRAALAEPPAAWQYRVDAPGIAGPIHAPMIGVGLYAALSWTNEEAALLHLERRRRGDDTVAIRRARENTAMALVLARSPHLAEHLAGRELLEEAGDLLVFVGERTGDSSVVVEGRRLRNAAWRLRGNDLKVVPRSPDADQALRSALALAGERRLPPAVRAMAAQEAMLAACLRPAEVMAGSGPMRDAALRDVSLALADVDPERRLRPAIERSATEWDALTRGGGWRATRRDVPGWARALGVLGLGGLTGRMFACAER